MTRLQSMAVFDEISGAQDKISGVQVCRLVLQKSQVCKCADLVDKYIGNTSHSKQIVLNMLTFCVVWEQLCTIYHRVAL